MPKQEYIKKIKAWEDLTIADDYMFNKVMLDKEICMQALSILKKIEEIKQQEDWRSEYMTMALREIEIRADALEEGELEGLRKGREEGLREGKIEGLREGEKKGKIEGLREGEKKGKIEGLREGEEKGKREGEKKGLKKSMYLWTKSLLETGIAKEKLVQLLMGIYGLEEEIARAYVEGEEIDWEKQSILDNKILEDTVLEDIVQENDSQVSKDKNKTAE